MKPALTVACLLFALCLGMIALRTSRSKDAAASKPIAYRVSMHASDTAGAALLPLASDDQALLDESFSSSGFRLQMPSSDLHRELRWEPASATPATLRYEVTVLPSRPRLFTIPTKDFMLVSTRPPEPSTRQVLAEHFARHRGASGTGARNLLRALRGEGFTARLCGGLDLARGSLPAPASWVEVLLGDQWVPFDPARGHFARHPARRLVLSRSLPDHSKILPISALQVTPLDPSDGARLRLGEQSSPLLAPFARAGISRSVVERLLLLPFACLVVLVARTLIGVETLGTFLPALLATSFHDTGLLSGMLLLVVALACGAVARILLEPLHLLHTARLAVILVAIVGGMLGATLWGASLGLTATASMALFPIVIITAATERTFQMIQQRGSGETLRVLLTTCIVIILCYGAMQSSWIRQLVFRYPEVLLAVVALFITLGRYTGLRLFELRRFRLLLQPQP